MRGARRGQATARTPLTVSWTCCGQRQGYTQRHIDFVHLGFTQACAVAAKFVLRHRIEIATTYFVGPFKGLTSGELHVHRKPLVRDGGRHRGNNNGIGVLVARVSRYDYGRTLLVEGNPIDLAPTREAPRERGYVARC